MATDEEVEGLRRQLLLAHEGMLERDQAFRAWEDRVSALEAELERVRGAYDELSESASRQVAELQAAMEAMKATRAWRLAERWWGLRAKVARR